MSYEDFMINWEILEMCHLTIDSFSDELLETDDVLYVYFYSFYFLSYLKPFNIFHQDSDLCWKETIYHSEWKRGISSGGCGQYNSG